MQVVIRKHELDRQQEAKPELLGFSWQTQLVGDEYSLKPIEEYRELFFWLLETSGIPYRLKRHGSSKPFPKANERIHEAD